MNTSQSTNASSDMVVVDINRLTGLGVELVMLTFGTVLNLLLIVTHIKDPLKTFKSPSSSFILNIAFVDILVCILWIIKIILNIISPGYRVNKETGDVLFCVWTASIAISPLLYLCLSIERFCSVAYPLWHRVHITTRACRYLLCAIWIVHIIFETLVSCLVPSPISNERVIIMLLYSGMSFIFGQVFYLATYISLKKQRGRLFKRQNISESTLGTMKIRLHREKQFLHTIAIVCLILNFTFLPSLGFMIFRAFHPDFRNIKQRELSCISFKLMLTVFLSFNFAINPIVYVWRLPKYRKTFKLLYCKSL